MIISSTGEGVRGYWIKHRYNKDENVLYLDFTLYFYIYNIYYVFSYVDVIKFRWYIATAIFASPILRQIYIEHLFTPYELCTIPMNASILLSVV